MNLSLPGFDGDGCDKETLHFLYGLVAYLKPALVVEAGTYRGAAACVMASAMRDFLIDGEVWTADIASYDAELTVTNNGLQDIVRRFAGDFGEMLNGPLLGRRFRMAFIDSGRVAVDGGATVATNVRHTHAELALSRLAPGGVLAIDDCAGQWDGVEALRDKASMYLPSGRGMILVQR